MPPIPGAGAIPLGPLLRHLEEALRYRMPLLAAVLAPELGTEATIPLALALGLITTVRRGSGWRREHEGARGDDRQIAWREHEEEDNESRIT